VVVSAGLILLAAGGSARLGRPKQLLEYEGKTLLRRAVETALASKCRPVVVVLRLVVNEGWKEGLASSIRAGLAVLEKEPRGVEAAILSVADQPQLTPALLDSLIEHQHTTGKKIIAAQYAGVPGPPALFCASLFPQLQTLQGDEGARRVLLKNPDEVVLVPFPDGALDVDTPADFEKLQKSS
jgi:molybdenum cofactor cytidylyltransferase